MGLGSMLIEGRFCLLDANPTLTRRYVSFADARRAQVAHTKELSETETKIRVRHVCCVRSLAHGQPWEAGSSHSHGRSWASCWKLRRSSPAATRTSWCGYAACLDVRRKGGGGGLL
jgi:hypothetical protein